MANTLFQEAVAAYHQQDYLHSLEMFEEIAKQEPDNIDVLNALGVLNKVLNRFNEAEAYYQKGLSIDAENVNILDNMASLTLRQRRYKDCHEWLQKALLLNPNSSTTLNNFGSLHLQLGDYEAALTCYQKALTLSSENHSIRFNLSWVLLRLGEFRQGFLFYESRFHKEGMRVALKNIKSNRWQGQSLKKGEILTFVCEQGFGDSIMFIRFVLMLLQTRHVKIEQIQVRIQNNLLRLMQSNFPKIHFISEDETVANDWYFPMMSLPFLLKIDPLNIPNYAHYLKPVATDVKKMRDFFLTSQSFKIGVCWQGSKTHENDYNRSIVVADLLQALSAVKGGTFYGLQKEISEEEKKLCADKIILLDQQMEDFASTAALIAHLDVVVSVDTAVAHLAASLGKPTIIFIPLVHDWRWFRARDNSPWYRNVKLLRQNKSNDWSTCFDQLNQLISANLDQRTKQKI